jgi:hypothetical protein
VLLKKQETKRLLAYKPEAVHTSRRSALYALSTFAVAALLAACSLVGRNHRSRRRTAIGIGTTSHEST